MSFLVKDDENSERGYQDNCLPYLFKKNLAALNSGKQPIFTLLENFGRKQLLPILFFA